MTTSSILTKELQELLKPDEDLMFTREGFDRRSIRREFAPVRTIDAGTKYVRQGNASYVHPDSSMPVGPTGEGESYGNIELVREIGGEQQIPRYVNGFTIEEEDLEVSEMAMHLQEMRDGIMELFDIQADLAFLQGLEDRAGNEVFSGVFEWLDNNIEADNVIDCSTFDLSTGDLNGLPANIVLRHAYGKVSGEYVETQWDLAVAKQSVWALWNEVGTNDSNGNRSQWEMIATDDAAGVGVNRRILVPERIGLRAPTTSAEKLQFDISFPTPTSNDDAAGDIAAADDVMYLVPNHGGDYYELYEQSGADVRGPLMKDGFRERFEYKWRAGVTQGQSFRIEGVAKDAIKLENVESLFL
ncbi:hypothetical protein M1M34_gp013 [Haloarcula tailed virus 2]|uniref:Major capsid protein n=1 Tax=Haloarcula tailed virus 2 TaxID=2877989 RepID=A0AAE8Y0L8_9CAUD|nr:hypothetical protein M1M34_gp013 [Haloarcula tailed virus 2]UBF23164.1 hypothetical protein HATV-2_gp13 [Haloarcula tailed virus 2]